MIFNLDSNSKEIKELKKDIAENANDIAINEQTLGYSCKNLLKNAGVDKSANGITYTMNDDGSISVKVSGSISQSQTDVGFFTPNFTGMVLLTGSSDAKTHLFAWNVTDGKRAYADSTKTTLQENNNDLYNKEVPFYVEKGKTYKIILRTLNTATLNTNFKVYPMVRKASILDDTFETYRESVAELLENGALNSDVMNMLTNENNETFNFGVKNGVRGFFTDPSRADDSFIPFIGLDFSIDFLVEVEINDVTYGETERNFRFTKTLYIIDGIPESHTFYGVDDWKFYYYSGDLRTVVTCRIEEIALIDKNKNKIKVLFDYQ